MSHRSFICPGYLYLPIVLFGLSSVSGILEFLLHLSPLEIFITSFLFQFHHSPVSLYPYGIPFPFSFSRIFVSFAMFPVEALVGGCRNHACF